MDVPTTYFSPALGKTDRTCKTDRSSNTAFLRILFGEVLDHIRPILVSFHGDPGSVSGSAWGGKAISACDLDLPPDANNYFSLAVFKSDDQGKFRRRKSQFHALHAIMLDDIGGKVPIERLTLRYPDENSELREVLHDIADERGEINRRRLGWWIKRHSGRIVNGRRFVRSPGNRSAEAWRVESVSPVLSDVVESDARSVSDG